MLMSVKFLLQSLPRIHTKIYVTTLITETMQGSSVAGQEEAKRETFRRISFKNINSRELLEGLESRKKH